MTRQGSWHVTSKGVVNFEDSWSQHPPFKDRCVFYGWDQSPWSQLPGKNMCKSDRAFLCFSPHWHLRRHLCPLKSFEASKHLRRHTFKQPKVVCVCVCVCVCVVCVCVLIFPPHWHLWRHLCPLKSFKASKHLQRHNTLNNQLALVILKWPTKHFSMKWNFKLWKKNKEVQVGIFAIYWGRFAHPRTQKNSKDTSPIHTT